MTTNEIFLDNLKSELEFQNMDQSSLARAIHRSTSWVYNVYHGYKSPTLNDVQNIATALNTTVIDMLEESF